MRLRKRINTKFLPFLPLLIIVSVVFGLLILSTPMVNAQEQVMTHMTGSVDGENPDNNLSIETNVNVESESGSASLLIANRVETENNGGGDEEGSVEVETETSLTTKPLLVSPRKRSRFKACVERLKNSKFNDGSVSDDIINVICKHRVGIITRASRVFDRMFYCIAQLSLTEDKPYRELKRECYERLSSEIIDEEVETKTEITGGEQTEAVENEEETTSEEVKEEVNKPGKVRRLVKRRVIAARRVMSEYEKCLKNVLEENPDITIQEARRKCVKYLKPIKKKVESLKPGVILRCLQAPDDVKSEIKELYEKLYAYKRKAEELYKERIEECDKINDTEEREECLEEKLGEIRKGYLLRTKEVLKKIRDIAKEYRMDWDCVRKYKEAEYDVQAYKAKMDELVMTNDPERLRSETRKVLNASNKEKALMLAKELWSYPEVRRAMIRELVKHKGVVKEMIMDPEVRGKIIEELKQNPEAMALVKQIVKERRARRELLSRVKNDEELRKRLMNKTVIREFLPEKLKERIENLKVQDLSVSDDNETVRLRVVRKARLLGLIPVNLREEVINNVNETRVRRPFWAFLVVGK